MERIFTVICLGIMLVLPNNSLSETITVVSSNTVLSGYFATEQVTCPTGMSAVGGGIDPFNVLNMKVTASGPTTNGTRLLSQPDGTGSAPTGWRASIRNDDTRDLSFKVAAVCMKPLFPWTMFLPAIIGVQ